MNYLNIIASFHTSKVREQALQSKEGLPVEITWPNGKKENANLHEGMGTFPPLMIRHASGAVSYIYQDETQDISVIPTI